MVACYFIYFFIIGDFVFLLSTSTRLFSPSPHALRFSPPPFRVLSFYVVFFFFFFFWFHLLVARSFPHSAPLLWPHRLLLIQFNLLSLDLALDCVYYSSPPECLSISFVHTASGVFICAAHWFFFLFFSRWVSVRLGFFFLSHCLFLSVVSFSFSVLNSFHYTAFLVVSLLCSFRSFHRTSSPSLSLSLAVSLISSEFLYIILHYM